MRIANTVSDSIVDGPGLRFTVFTQGCPHRCPGCHNPGTHDPAGGREVSVAELAAELSGNPLTDGLTLSGGEPFCQAAECAALARIAWERGLNVWAYTGYTYERLLAGEVPDALALLEQVDVLVDGPFVEAEKSYAALFRGSANQRLISANSCYHFQIADAAGRAVVVEYIGDEMNVVESPRATNFLLTEGDWDFGRGQDRFAVLEETMEASGGVLTEEEGMALLQAVSQQPQPGKDSSTQWSCLYNQVRGTVDIAVAMDYDSLYHFAIDE